jgi:type VI secretion system Hcp family effector
MRRIELKLRGVIGAVVVAVLAGAAVAVAVGGSGDNFTQPTTPVPVGNDTVYANLDGVKGDSTARGHEGEIDVLALDYGVSPPTAACRAVEFREPFGKSTPTLYADASKGRHLNKAVFTLEKTIKGTQRAAMVLTLTDVTVAAVHSTAQGDARTAAVAVAGPFDDVTLEPAEIDVYDVISNTKAEFSCRR